jgi:putative GTP pyrophosphokinase
MNSIDFSLWLGSQQESLEAWGKFVVKEVTARVSAEIGEKRYKGFFKVPPVSRVKEIDSALKKFTKKQYDEPKHQMSDLVGARFVVLLRTDIPIVESAIQANNSWTVRRDRNPLDERLEAPLTFDYQSVHYIVRNTEDRLIEGVPVPADIACEVQVRTVLQHAYAELGHDRIYKEDGPVPKSVHRLVARCMALMETTDEIFCSAVEELDRVNLSRGELASLLDAQYADRSVAFLPSLQDDEAVQILDTFKEQLRIADMQSFLAQFPPALWGKIKERADGVNLFAKPAALAVYWLVQQHGDYLKNHWPLPKFNSNVEQIKSDLGIA